MKRIILIGFVSLFLLNCSKENDEPFVEEVSVKGNFISGAHPTSGEVLVDDAMTKLSMVNFKTDDGPKLLVYLTTAVGSNDYISLGDLKGVDGDYIYDIPASTDLTKYKIVDIWCVDFSVSFGHAELK